MDRQTLLSKLPRLKDQWVTITEDQRVPDIIREVLGAHIENAKYYDSIALYFDGDTVEEICSNIYTFCKKQLYYKEETPEDQTTLIPANIIIRGANKDAGVDCKHYSGFAGGILDAMNRVGARIKWCYRFASYDLKNKMPHHVFVVVNPDGDEIWIDPTPKANILVPYWQIDKKIKAAPMALRRNIAGIDEADYLELLEYPTNTIGKRPTWQLMPMEGARTQPNAAGPGPNNRYFTGPFLGLQFYAEDPLSIEGTNWNITADAINAAIQNGPSPGHAVDGSFVRWIYESNVKGWNFYYPMGVAPGYQPNLPNSYPQLIITADGRLTFDRDVQIDDYLNDEVHALSAWAQALINAEDPTPYPVKPRHLKEFSQLKYGNVDTRNLFTERRGKGVMDVVGKAFERIGKAVKVVGISVFRNAFLGLIGINAFNWAKNLQDKIDQGEWNSIARTWEKLGGKPEKLLNTINDGKGKPPTENPQANKIGFAIESAIAAAAPIIALMLKYLDKNGKAGEILSVVKGVVGVKFPDLDLTAFGFLDKQTGEEVEIKIEDKDNENLPGYNGGGSSFDPLQLAKDNPIPTAAIVAGLLYFLTGKKSLMIPAVAGIGTYFLLQQQGGGSKSPSQMRKELNAWADSTVSTDGEANVVKTKQIFAAMTASEINSTYDFVFNHVAKNIPVIKDSPLYKAIVAISEKYKIFN